jgi:cytochrome b pre-mRNA-processing protein 3
MAAGAAAGDEGRKRTMIFTTARRRSERDAADAIYASAVAASRRPGLYAGLGVPDTLDGRFEMLALSLFPPIERLMHDPGDEPDLARRVAETFVTDMDAAYREMGIGDTIVPKKMKLLYRSFAGRLSAYRIALPEGEDMLAAAIARNVFLDEAPAGSAAALARQAIAACAAFRAAPIDLLRRGEVVYPPVGV